MSEHLGSEKVIEEYLRAALEDPNRDLFLLAVADEDIRRCFPNRPESGHSQYVARAESVGPVHTGSFIFRRNAL